MRHAPTACARLWRAVLLAALGSLALLTAWGAALPATAADAGPQSAAQQQPASAHGLPATTGHPDEAEDRSSALAPIALGLVLTGIASYKHRGLPRGH